MFHRKKYDPRTLLLLTTCFSSMAVFIRQPAVLLGLVISIMIVMWLLGITVTRSLQRLYRFMRIFFPIIIIQSLFNPLGEPIIQLGTWRLLTTTGLEQGILFLLRMTLIILSATLLTLTTPRDMIQGLVQLKMPYELAFMVSVAIRFLPLLKQEIGDALVAIQLRGVDPKTLTWRRRAKVYSALFLPIVLSTLQRARHLAIAMEMRAFRAYATRSSYYQLNLQHDDVLIMIAACIATGTVFWNFI